MKAGNFIDRSTCIPAPLSSFMSMSYMLISPLTCVACSAPSWAADKRRRPQFDALVVVVEEQDNGRTLET